MTKSSNRPKATGHAPQTNRHDPLPPASSLQPPAPLPPASRLQPPACPRRGVLLLVVLSLLVLFALIGITFVLVAGKHLSTTKMALRDEQRGEDPRKLCDAVLGQIVRGTTDTHSVLRGHDLLADLYGNDGVRGTVDNLGPTPIAGGQFVDLRVVESATAPMNPEPMFWYADIETSPGPPPVYSYLPIVSQSQMRTPGYYNGCVLTMLGGAAAGKTTRIVGWGYASGTSTYTIRVMGFEGIDATTTTISGPFIINGRPFNGTGFGFKPTADPATEPTLLVSQELVPTDANPSIRPPKPYALLPNPVFSRPTMPGVTPPHPPYPLFGGIGGADEEYDAADPQNMALAYLPLNPTPIPGAISIIPSFHRPDLIWHMGIQQLGPTFTPAEWYKIEPSVLRRIMLRPFGTLPPTASLLDVSTYLVDHTAFTGSNPNFNPIFGPFDVDNDGDGIAESVWIDVGFPVQTAPDGRAYKPLAAMLVLDMDGRLNVNAHGNVAHVDSYYFGASGFGTPSGAETDFTTVIPPACFGLPTMPNLTRGQGYGPPEISLYPLFSPLGSPSPALILSDYANLLAARYGEPNTNLNSATYDSSVWPNTTNPYPGITCWDGAWDDRLAGLKFNEYTWPTGSPVVLSGFASPHNLSSKGFPFLDVRGTPLSPYMGNPNDLLDDPYEFDLSRRRVRAATSPVVSVSTPASPDLTPNPVDSPFTVAELERVLRIYDVDATQLPDRLRVLVDGAGGPPLAILRSMITTDSVDLPSPGILPTRDLRAVARAQGSLPEISQSISDLLRVRLTKGMCPSINDEIKKMLPPELAASQRMDVNRPFGNTRDDNINGIVDEPSELPEMSYWNTSRTPTTDFNSVPSEVHFGIDVNSFVGIPDSDDKKLARQLYARHLYVLMMLLKDEAANVDFDGNPSNNSPAETARGIAQWAINVVDFRDRDSIMTPFEYDINPFDADGWNVDSVVNLWQGILSADDTAPQRGLVWGCERPELLITETLAFHDRRSEDLTEGAIDSSDAADLETLPGMTTDTMQMKDSDFDQSLRPFGPFFVELYNPWTTESSTTDLNGRPSALESSGEFQTIDTTANEAFGIQLNKATPVGNSPIWRMTVVKGPSLLLDPDNPDPTPPVFQKTHVDRAVYFRDPAGITDLPAATSYYPHPAEPPAPLLPGRYAVVGSAGLLGLNSPGTYVNPIGRKTGAVAGDATQTRRIVLMPNPNPNTQQVFVQDNAAPNGPVMYPEPAPIDIQNTVAVALRLAKTSAGAPMIAPAQFTASISEPPNGYASIAAARPGAPTFNPVSGAEGTYSATIDHPLDKHNPTFAVYSPAFANSQPPDGTLPTFAMIHLQRLADPTQAWHATANPYLTIDTMSVDLTVFNGVTSQSDMRVGGADAGIAAYQRGDPGAIPTAPFWGRQPLRPAAPAPVAPLGGLAHNFNFALQHTLGYLNTAYGIEATATAFSSTSAPLPSYTGAPNSPLPWLTWNNRPFVGPMEMLLVPKSRSSQLLFEYAGLPVNLYNTPAPPPPGTPGTGHLFNFFRVPAMPLTPPLPQLHRIFDYLQVPSRFAGTETVLNPASIPPLAGLPNETELFSLFRPPFNKVSNYRDPGRVNINTIPSDAAGNSPFSAIWNGIVNSAPGGLAAPAWADVFHSRQGAATYDPTTTPTSTMFANPFRSAAGASLLLPGAINNANRDEVDVTLLRPLAPATNIPDDVPLFNYMSAQTYDNSTANPYFRLQNLQRLSNLLTTRSNVYAIWITIGYFEVTSKNNLNTRDLAKYPDGYELGQELGIDTGEVTRHRAFYIYDRSIPVGFEPGKDHNFENGLLLRRFIE